MKLVFKLCIYINNLTSINSLLFKNSFWLIFDQGLRMLFALIIGSWTARYLGKSGYGQVSFVLSYLALFQIISGLGLEATVVRDLIHYRFNANKIFTSVFLLKFLIGLINWFVSFLIIISFFGLDDNTYILVFIGGVSLIFQSFSIIELWFQSNNISFKIVFPKLVASVIANFLKIILIVSGASIYYFIAAYSFEALLSAIFLAIALKGYPVSGKYIFDFAISKKILKDSFPFLVSAISIYFYTRFDMFLIKKELGDAQVGIYNAAISISTILPILPMILLNVLTPFVAKKKIESEFIYQESLKIIFRVFTFSGIFLSLIFYFLSDYFVLTLFGPDFSDSASVLKVHVFGNIFIYMGIAQNIWIVNENKGAISIYKTLVGILLSFILNIILIPQYGVVGAAYSALLVQLVSSFLINYIIAPEAFKLQLRSFLYFK